MIVTGASSGIGRAIALHAAQAGFAIVAVGRRSAILEELAQDIHVAGGLCTAVPVDLRSLAAASAVASTAIQRYERIDAVVHAAGAAAAGTLLSQADAQLNEQWEIHVLAPLRLTREALPALRATRGHVFFLASRADPAVKAAVQAIATQLQRELRADAITVTYLDGAAVAEQVASSVIESLKHDVQPPPAHSTPQPPSNAALNEALEPLKRRLERVRLSREFIASLLVPGTTLQLSEVAMRWAGMPNKNERAATREVLEALETASYVAKTDAETWTVLKAGDAS